MPVGKTFLRQRMEAIGILTINKARSLEREMPLVDAVKAASEWCGMEIELLVEEIDIARAARKDGWICRI